MAKRKKPAPPSGPVTPPAWAVDLRASQKAASVLYEYGADQFAGLLEHDDANFDGPILAGLRLVVRSFAYELLVNNRVIAVRSLLRSRFGLTMEFPSRDDDEQTLDRYVADATAPQLLAVMLELAATLELGEGPLREASKDLLDFAELDWDQLRQQAYAEIEAESNTPSE